MNDTILVKDLDEGEWVRCSLANFREVSENVKEQIIANHRDAFLKLIHCSPEVERWRIGALDKLFSAQCVDSNMLVDTVLDILYGAQSEEEALIILKESLENAREWPVSVASPEHPPVDSRSEEMPENCVESESGGWKPAPGYVKVSKKRGDYRVKWCPGEEYGKDYPNVIAAEGEGMWLPGPGYVWENTQSDSPRMADKIRHVEWSPGSNHRDAPHVFAAEEEHQWYPESGYDFVNNDYNDLSVQWAPGDEYVGCPNVVADMTEGMWVPKPGYVWKRTKNDLPRTWEQINVVTWCQGRSNRDVKNILSSKEEGKWVPASGYIWRKSAFAKELKKTAVIEDYENYKAEIPFSYYINQLKEGEILYRELPDIVRKFLNTMREPKNLEEIHDEGLLPLSWQPGLPMPRHSHVFAARTPGWMHESGYDWVNRDDEGDYRLRKIRKSNDYEFQSGDGDKYPNVDGSYTSVPLLVSFKDFKKCVDGIGDISHKFIVADSARSHLFARLWGKSGVGNGIGIVSDGIILLGPIGTGASGRKITWENVHSIATLNSQVLKLDLIDSEKHLFCQLLKELAKIATRGNRLVK